ncbi:MAG: hypothetical protein JWM53_6058, partial [bacterium]|nr:hypothetical protein [bacterium]
RAQLAAQSAPAARKRLRAVADEAKAHGFALVARRALDLLR